VDRYRTLLFPCCWILILGCGFEDPNSHENQKRLFADKPDRYARRFLPFDPSWKRESEYVEIQKTPRMVIWEVSDFPADTKPTPEQQRAAEDLVERCFEAARRHGWSDIENGLADGYQSLLSDPTHYRKPESLSDDGILDPDRPEALMYYPTRAGRMLVGMMFQTKNRFDRGPQIGGSLTNWHYHVWSKTRCVDDAGGSSGMSDEGSKCPEGFFEIVRSREMIHVWLIDRSTGPFASAMWVQSEELKEGLERRLRERGF